VTTETETDSNHSCVFCCRYRICNACRWLCPPSSRRILVDCEIHRIQVLQRQHPSPTLLFHAPLLASQPTFTLQHGNCDTCTLHWSDCNNCTLQHYYCYRVTCNCQSNAHMRMREIVPLFTSSGDRRCCRCQIPVGQRTNH